MFHCCALGGEVEILFQGFFCLEKDCSETPDPPFSGGERPKKQLES